MTTHTTEHATWQPPVGSVAGSVTDEIRQVTDKALEQVGFKLVASRLTYCLSHPDEAAESGYDLDRVEKMSMKIS